jgi:acetyl-CoA C-acetyltransferase
VPDAVIVDAVRTPIGRAGRGSLRDVRADDLAAVALRALVERNPEVDFADTDDVVMGCGFQLGEQGHNVGRNAALLAGFDVGVPATTVNRFCASSLQAVCMAFHAIVAGEGRQYVAAGVEAVSRFPSHPPYDRHPDLDGSPGSLHDVYVPMGVTAENVAEARGVSRAAQDEWAAISQQRAVAARDAGHFDAEIAPVTLPDGTRVTRDDGPRPGTTPERLAALEPVFKPGGTVTAGNACPLNDGAAAVLVMAAERARQIGARPRARVLASAVAGVRPEEMGLGPLPAVARVLTQAGLAMSDVDLVELNEAFAAQVVPCRDEWGLDWERLNPYGGAIALGHPFGMTGARLVTTLLGGLEARDASIGLVALCVAGGMGQALLIERLD